MQTNIFEDALDPEDKYYELMLDGGESGRTLTAAITEGLAIRLIAKDAAFETRHYLIFLFKDGESRNNYDALRRWVKEQVVFRLTCGLDEIDVFDSVVEAFDKALQNAGWT